MRAAIGVCVLAALAHSNVAAQVAIQVLDGFGAPLADVSVDNHDRKLRVTDRNGQITLEQPGRDIVFRKGGYHSGVLPAPGVNGNKVALRVNEKGTAFPVCSGNGWAAQLQIWSPRFRFPKNGGVRAAKPVRGFDYETQAYFAKGTQEEGAAVRHGYGPTWSFGQCPTPRWGFEGFDEVTYESGSGTTITECCGKLPNGNFFRYIGRFGETASYNDVTEATAALLDRILDAICLQTVSN